MSTFGLDKKRQGGDPRIEELFNSLELSYEVDSMGDFKFIAELEGGRSQIALVRSKTYEFCEVEMRQIVSPALRSSGPFDPRTTDILLKQNHNVELGAWAVTLDHDDNHIAIFMAQVAADLTTQQFAQVLFNIVSIADEMEERLTGRDEF